MTSHFRHDLATEYGLDLDGDDREILESAGLDPEKHNFTDTEANQLRDEIHQRYLRLCYQRGFTNITDYKHIKELRRTTRPDASEFSCLDLEKGQTLAFATFGEFRAALEALPIAR